MLLKHDVEQTCEDQSYRGYNFEIGDNSFIARFAKNEQEIDEALRLRFEVFNLELGEGLQSSYISLRDKDIYDHQCDHLIIIHRETNEIIGTYRLQAFENALAGFGFYSASEFELNCLPESLLQQSIELGRACIQKEYRNKKVLYLLWCGIARYAMIKEKRYLFGCCSLTSQSPHEGMKLYSQLKETNALDSNYCIPATTDYSLPLRVDINNTNDIENPPLLSMYLRYGARVISMPAIDREFSTIDYLILLDIATLAPAIRKMFFTFPESGIVYYPPTCIEKELL